MSDAARQQRPHRGGRADLRVRADGEGHRVAVTDKEAPRRVRSAGADARSAAQVLVTGAPASVGLDKARIPPACDMRQFLIARLKQLGGGPGRVWVYVGRNAITRTGTSLWVSVAGPEQARELVRVVDGAVYQESLLSAVVVAKSEASKGAEELIARVLAANYNEAQASLDLSGFAGKTGGRLSLAQVDTARAVMDQVAAALPGLVFLSLDDNRLESLQPFVALARKCPTVQALFAKRNLFRSPRDLAAVRSLSLVRIGVEGNPWDNPDKNVLYDELKKLFPNLMMIDGDNVASPFQFNLPGYLTAPCIPGVRPGFSPSPQVGSFAERFVRGFFQMLEGASSEALLQLYTDRSTLSVTFSGEALHMEQTYKRNRNLADVLTRRDRTGTRYEAVAGSFKIVSALLEEMPKAVHSLDNQALLDVVEAVTGSATPLIVVTIYGVVRFPTLDAQKERSFTRRLVLQNTTANALGAVILNDQYSITGYLGRNPALQACIEPPAERQQMCASFQKETHLNAAFTRQALENNAWSYEAAAANFAQLQASGSIPAAAFE
eukprot:m51a1_g6320 hypothetical protein (551) ;mRNA; f:350395-353163